MSTRRTFFRRAGALAGALALDNFFRPGFTQKIAGYQHFTPDMVATDEDFWGWVRNEFPISRTLTNLNNGGVSPSPLAVQEAMFQYFRQSNEAPSYYMWRQLDQGREALRGKLAELAGCEADEIAINRNSTESLNTIIFGLNLKKGDEVVTTHQDYPNMINAWKQREKRDGLVIKRITIPLPEDDDEKLTSLFVQQFTPRTKLVHITHIINWSGQILPVRKIADEAHKRGIEVLVDGAHSFAHLNYRIPDLGADYFGTSLHKWLHAPFGSGLLYIKKEKIKNIWALLSSTEPDGADIRKFESLGTRSFASEMAIGHAVDFHLTIGAERKEKRLIYLKQYWTEKLKNNPKIIFNTTLAPEKSCAICTMRLSNMSAADLESKLMEKYRIHTVNIQWPGIDGIRVTPNIYTSLKELDHFTAAIQQLSKA